MLDDLGLLPALTTYMKDIRKQSGLKIELKTSSTAIIESLDSLMRTVLYRIVQEALKNVVNHAKASSVKVSIRVDSGVVYLEVSDDGKSFSLAAIRKEKSGKYLGLIGMRERAEMIGGSFDLDSTPGKGTKISVRIPCRSDIYPPQNDVL